MTITLRATSNGLILDLHGQWPRSDDECRRVREDMDEALKERAGSLIYYIHDAKLPKAVHVGLLVGVAMRAKGISHGFAIVSPSEEFRRSLSAIFPSPPSPGRPIVGIYETEEEAFRDMEWFHNWKVN